MNYDISLIQSIELVEANSARRITVNLIEGTDCVVEDGYVACTTTLGYGYDRINGRGWMTLAQDDHPLRMLIPDSNVSMMLRRDD